jgi:hypothetical protein
MQRRTSNAKPDCEEKRDPDKRYLNNQKKENELDPGTQLEKRPVESWSFAPLSLRTMWATPFRRGRSLLNQHGCPLFFLFADNPNICIRAG